VIDSDGRLFGRFNLVDAAAIAFALFLIPVGYATFLLFRPSSPVIDSVTRVDVTNEERRVSGVGMIIAKFKVKGSGFNPLLRARIADAEAMGFRFENPNSADVIVGIVPPGRHDLVLYDGVQEVARAREAIEIKATEGPSVRAYGWLTNLAASDASVLTPGFASDPRVPHAFQILAIGPPQPARSRVVSFGGGAIDLPVADRVERQAELQVRCDWPSAGACTLDGAPLTLPPPIVLTLPGPFAFHLLEVAPPVDPRRAMMRLQLSGPTPAIKAGDRDASVGSRTAEIVSVGAGSNPIVTLRLGVDESREGWRYRGQLVLPGAPFLFRSAAYLAGGTIVALSIEP
jgi:hypothetical protein